MSAGGGAAKGERDGGSSQAAASLSTAPSAGWWTPPGPAGSCLEGGPAGAARAGTAAGRLLVDTGEPGREPPEAWETGAKRVGAAPPTPGPPDVSAAWGGEVTPPTRPTRRSCSDSRWGAAASGAGLPLASAVPRSRSLLSLGGEAEAALRGEVDLARWSHSAAAAGAWPPSLAPGTMPGREDGPVRPGRWKEAELWRWWSGRSNATPGAGLLSREVEREPGDWRRRQGGGGGGGSTYTLPMDGVPPSTSGGASLTWSRYSPGVPRPSRPPWRSAVLSLSRGVKSRLLPAP